MLHWFNGTRNELHRRHAWYGAAKQVLGAACRGLVGLVIARACGWALVCEQPAIEKAGYKPGEDISICLDPAASEMWDDGKYVFFKSTKKAITSWELIKIWESWTNHPIVLLEDGMGENDWDGWRDLTETLGSRIELDGDDVFCTNPRILQEGIEKGVANAILIKLNQIGSVPETLYTIGPAEQNSYRCFVSHRSGETEDTFISDLTVATGAGHIKTGSGCRSERVAKFNQFLRIEEELGTAARFAGKAALIR